MERFFAISGFVFLFIGSLAWLIGGGESSLFTMICGIALLADKTRAISTAFGERIERNEP